MSAPLILSIDQGTTSSRAMLFDANLSPIWLGGTRPGRDLANHFACVQRHD